MVNSSAANYSGFTSPASDGNELGLADVIKELGNKSEWCPVFIDSFNAISCGLSSSTKARLSNVLQTLSFSIFR